MNFSIKTFLLILCSFLIVKKMSNSELYTVTNDFGIRFTVELNRHDSTYVIKLVNPSGESFIFRDSFFDKSLYENVPGCLWLKAKVGDRLLENGIPGISSKYLWNPNVNPSVARPIEEHKHLTLASGESVSRSFNLTYLIKSYMESLGLNESWDGDFDKLKRLNVEIKFIASIASKNLPNEKLVLESPWVELHNFGDCRPGQ